jgi:acetate kinase
MTGREILTINAGSSSIKFAVFHGQDALRRGAQGVIDRIGSTDAVLVQHDPASGRTASTRVSATDHDEAAGLLLEHLHSRLSAGSLLAIGHRVVHGGPLYFEAQRVTAELLQALRGLIPLDPQHLPQEIALIEAFRRRMPELPEVVCFDTAFHHALPRVAQLLPLPRRYAEQGLRRYGFHGLSYAYVLMELARIARTDKARGRTILAHLGNGASLAAVDDGDPVDTSMGFTPAGGVMMGTRTGDIDPGLVSWFADTERMDAERFSHLFNFESGLIGVSETSSDMRDLLALQGEDVRAAEAVALFCYQVRKCIGAFAAALGGLDTLVFTGGIGENAPEVRARICDGLGFLGVELAEDRNRSNGPVISNDASRVTVRIVRTDEESMIAKSVLHVLARA